jgi:Do/DeqQ family serine protease
MAKHISLKSTGVIVAAAAIFAFFLGLAISGGLSFTQPVQESPELRVPLVTETGESPFVAVAAQVMPAVVNISAEKVEKVPGFEFQFEGPFEDLFKRFFPEPFFKEPEARRTSLGSGVIIDERGYILTNNHVISGAQEIMIRLPDETEYQGKKVKIVGRDPKTDLAVLKIEDKRKFPYAWFGNSDGIKVGDWAIAIGNPFGFENTLTVGVISAKGRSGVPLPEGPSYQDFIQTDASINPGNSGGPLINIHGEVIGINTAITSPTRTNIGIGFAIPASMAKSVAEQLIEKGKVIRGYLGVQIQPITPNLKEGLGLSSTEGVLVADVLPGYPAERAGFKPGDVVVKLQGKPVKDLEGFRRMVAATPPGTEVEIEVLREGKRHTLKARLIEAPEEEVSLEPERPVKEWLGLMVRDLTPDERAQLGEKGVIVQGLLDNSQAARAGIKPGDVIIEIQGQEVQNLADYNRIRKELSGRKEPVILRIRRDDSRIFLAVRPD